MGSCRAEATDVANAVLDGVDCIMLGAETLRGKHPVATVETILHICKQAEKVFDHDYHFETIMRVRGSCCGLLQQVHVVSVLVLACLYCLKSKEGKACCGLNDAVSCVNSALVNPPPPSPLRPPPLLPTYCSCG